MRTHPCPWSIAAAACALVLACGSTSGKETKPSDFVSCVRDDQCSAGEGCNVEGNSKDGYCSALCSDGTTCPARFECPSFVRSNERSDCDEVGRHAGGKGVCDQFVGARGPQTCGAADE